jgi:hypothetical protein
MAQPTKRSKKNLIIVAGIVCAVILIGITVGVYTNFFDLNKSNTPTDTYVPSLVSVDLQLKDDRTNSSAPFLHVTGTIRNQGNGTANNVTLHVYAIQDQNTTAIDKTQNVESIEAGADQPIDLSFTYTGKALSAYNQPELSWTS